jgi:hypothetical protein
VQKLTLVGRRPVLVQLDIHLRVLQVRFQELKAGRAWLVLRSRVVKDPSSKRLRKKS